MTFTILWSLLIAISEGSFCRSRVEGPCSGQRCRPRGFCKAPPRKTIGQSVGKSQIPKWSGFVNREHEWKWMNMNMDEHEWTWIKMHKNDGSGCFEPSNLRGFPWGSLRFSMIFRYEHDQTQIPVAMLSTSPSPRQTCRKKGLPGS